MYKTLNNLTPAYMLDTIPPPTQNHYQLRNADNTPNINVRTSLLQRSFFPQTIVDWNNLNVNITSAPSLSIFKSRLKKNVKDKPPDWYYTGDRYLSIIHARMQMLCIPLNDHLFSHIHVYDNPACSCGHSRENARHYF